MIRPILLSVAVLSALAGAGFRSSSGLAFAALVVFVTLFTIARKDL